MEESIPLQEPVITKVTNFTTKITDLHILFRKLFKTVYIRHQDYECQLKSINKSNL